MKPSELSDLQLDALRELGSIGAGHAATALSQLVDRAVDIAVPTIQLVPVAQVPQLLGGPERLVGAVHCRMLGDIAGSLLFLAPREACLGLVDLLRGHDVGTAKSCGSEEQLLVSHVASILISAYLAAIARMTDINLLPSTPSFALDMAGGILEVVTAEVGMKVDTALLVRTRFLGDGDHPSVEAALFFLPDPDSLDVLLGRLGIV